MLLEETKDALVDLIAAVNFAYNSYLYDVTVMRAGDDFPDEVPIITISFIPTREKKGVSINNFLGVRDNKYYSNYGYWDVELCVVRGFSRAMNGSDGRALAQAWLIQIEKYIKINWTKLINGVSFQRHSFIVPREIYKSTGTDKVFGFETQFKVISPNLWTNEPEEGIRTPIPVEEIGLVDPQLKLRVKKNE